MVVLCLDEGVEGMCIEVFGTVMMIIMFYVW